MPDFLPKRPDPTGPPAPEPRRGFGLFPHAKPDAPSAAPIAPPLSPLNPSRNPKRPSGPSAQPQGPEEGSGDHIASIVRKAPSKFWTEYYAVAFILLVGAFLTVGLLILQPLLVRYRQINGEIVTASTVLADERSYLESLQRSIFAAQEIPPETLEKVEEALPRGVDIPKLLVVLSRVAKQNGVSLNSVQFGVGAGDDLTQVNIGMNISAADYLTLRTYLHAVEQNLQILDLQSISVVPTRLGESGGQTYPVILHTYALPAAPTGLHTP